LVIIMEQLNNIGEIALYHIDDYVKLEVRLEDETVWLTQQQMVELFDSSKANISEHISNIYSLGELEQEATVRKFRIVRHEGTRLVNRNIDHYNLDVIISVGFRVNSIRGVRFRQWANKILRDYLLRGYSINQQLVAIQQQLDVRFEEQNIRISKLEESHKQVQGEVQVLTQKNILPQEKLFPTGCVFDSWNYVSNLVRSAKKRIILVDNFVDDRVLALLTKRADNVSATIHSRFTIAFAQDLEKHNKQYKEINFVQLSKRNHDRFLIIDNVVYLLGASVKDMGTGLCAITKMELSPDVIINEL